MNIVIGCGGVGGFVIELLAKLTEDIYLMDGDTVEEKNLDRQLFNADQIGENKAIAFLNKYALEAGWEAYPEYFHSGTEFEEPLNPDDLLWCCADNHACRRQVLLACDHSGCCAVLGANEYTDAEAYWYEPEWRGTPNDPRVFHPAINTDLSGDPLSPAGCTGAAAVASPQLVLANDWAAGMMMHLYWFHMFERPDLDHTDEIKACWPVHHKVNKFKFQTIRFGDRYATT